MLAERRVRDGKMFVVSISLLIFLGAIVDDPVLEEDLVLSL